MFMLICFRTDYCHYMLCPIKRIENEREAQLLLKGAYNFYNRPQKFIPLHSRVLVSVLLPDLLTYTNQ